METMRILTKKNERLIADIIEAFEKNGYKVSKTNEPDSKDQGEIHIPKFLQ